MNKGTIMTAKRRVSKTERVTPKQGSVVANNLQQMFNKQAEKLSKELGMKKFSNPYNVSGEAVTMLAASAKEKTKSTDLSPLNTIKKHVFDYAWNNSGIKQIIQESMEYINTSLYQTHTFYDELAKAISSELLSEWTIIFSKNTKYVECKLDIDVIGNTKLVLFKKPGDYVLFKRNNMIIWAYSDHRNHIKIIFPRIGFDLDEFMMIALSNAKSDSQDRANWNRFTINTIVGSEKDKLNFNMSVGAKSLSIDDDNDPDEYESNPGPNLLSIVDPTVDQSFMYDLPRYNFPKIHKDVFADLYYSDNVLSCVERARNWYSLKDWYMSRNIPWKVGFLFHGVGGTGKSEMAKTMAKDLSIPVYQYFLNTLSDNEFIHHWDNMNTPCIALFEDFDNVFHGRVSQTEHKSLTFDCVLNQISGVNSMSGVMLIVTTNDISKIDPAMGIDTVYGNISTRPGRIDVVAEFGLMETKNREKMFDRILDKWPEIRTEIVAKGNGLTPAQFQELCVQTAISMLHTNEVI